MAIRPFDFIHKTLKKEVIVTMKNGSTFTGKMISYDENLNLFLTDAKEHCEKGRNLKTIVLKGGNIVSVSPLE